MFEEDWGQGAEGSRSETEVGDVFGGEVPQDLGEEFWREDAEDVDF